MTDNEAIQLMKNVDATLRSKITLPRIRYAVIDHGTEFGGCWESANTKISDFDITIDRRHIREDALGKVMDTIFHEIAHTTKPASMRHTKGFFNEIKRLKSL